MLHLTNYISKDKRITVSGTQLIESMVIQRDPNGQGSNPKSVGSLFSSLMKQHKGTVLLCCYFIPHKTQGDGSFVKHKGTVLLC